MSISESNVQRSGAGEYSVAVITHTEDLSALANDWSRLSNSTKFFSVFSSFEWFIAWQQALVKEDVSRRLHVLVIKRNGRVEGLAPLVRRNFTRFGFAMRKLEFVAEFADYNELILGNDPVPQAAAAFGFLADTASGWDLIELRGLSEGGLTPDLLTATLAGSRLSYRLLPEENRCPFFTVEGDRSQTLQRISAHARSNIRRRMQQAISAGLTVRIVEAPHCEPGLLEKMAMLEKKKQALKKTPALLSRYPEVFRKLLESTELRGLIYAALLEKGSQLAGFQLGFLCGSKLWDYSKAYDPAFARLSPGILLLVSLLDFAREREIREYDFLCGDEPYKQLWSTGYHDRYRLVAWNQRTKSRVRAYLYNDVRPVARRLMNQITGDNH